MLVAGHAMNAAAFARKVGRDRSVRRVLVGAILGPIIWLTFSSAPVAQNTGDCGKSDPGTGDLLRCVANRVRAASDQDIADEPLRVYLQKLAETPGYGGTSNDLEELKNRSLKLKTDPVTNRLSIAALDNAIASYVDELRAGVSYKALTARASPGADIYPDFVRQKVNFLGSQQAEFYNLGPFELTRRALWASSLEAGYFIASEKGVHNREVLRKAIDILHSVREGLASSKYQFLSASQRSRSQINSYFFWEASLLLALKEQKQAQGLLRALAIDNHTFGPQTTDAGHVYIYRVFARPYKMIVKAGGAVDVDGLHVVNRFYNPAQLALFACAYLADEASIATKKFDDSVSDMALNDYFVVAAASDDPVQLAGFNDTIGQTLNRDDFRPHRERLLQDVANQEIPSFFENIKRGAQLCDVDNSIRDRIYSRFDLTTRIERFDNLIKPSHEIVLGGHLNEDQAHTIAEFFNGIVFKSPTVAGMWEKLGGKKAFMARMRIEQ
jgi:hypothetical protein